MPKDDSKVLGGKNIVLAGKVFAQNGKEVQKKKSMWKDLKVR